VIAERGRTAIGAGWRPELALVIDQNPALDFLEVTAENIDLAAVPAALQLLRDRGLPITVHGLSLSLGGTEPINRGRIERLRRLAEKLGAPLVSEHVAFVRAEGVEVGHLLPVPRTEVAMDLLAENVGTVKRIIGRPLALENIATFIEWGDGELDEPAFFCELLERTDSLLLLDVSNLYANCRNHGWDANAYLRRMPLHRLAYVHIGGGVERHGLYHDTHAHSLPEGALNLLEELCAIVRPPAVMLERDDEIDQRFDLALELARMRGAIERGEHRRNGS